MNILMHGAGALGSYFGGRMLEAGLNVSFFVRERRAEQLTKEGLKLISPEGDFEQKDITVYTSTEKVKNIDLIVLAVKGYHLKDAIQQVKTIVNQTGAFVLPAKWDGAYRDIAARGRRRKSNRWICFHHCYVK